MGIAAGANVREQVNPAEEEPPTFALEPSWFRCGEARAARRAPKELAEASGGLDYYPKSLSEVESVTPQMLMRFAINTFWLIRR